MIVAWEEQGYRDASLRELIVSAKALGLRLRGVGDFASGTGRDVAAAAPTAQEDRQRLGAR